MIKVTATGSFSNIEKFAEEVANLSLTAIMEYHAKKGLAALIAATPKESSITSDSWSYIVNPTKGSESITWTNSNLVDGVPVVILLQYGHATGTGAYVQGQDFINPALKNTFDDIADQIWKVVISS